MPINLFPVCFRNRDDCQPIHCIDAMPDDTTEEDYMNFTYKPDSFVCSGTIKKPGIPQDKYRLCFKNHCADEISDNDLMDLTSLMAVISAALNIDAVRKVTYGIVELPAEQNKDVIKKD